MTNQIQDIQIIKEIQKELPNNYDTQYCNPNHWTSDMIKFYNDDWGNEETFSVENIQRKMDKSPALWKISQKDLLRQHRSKRYYAYCDNCRQPGHVAYKCPEPLYVPKCHMCGTPGHIDHQCPNAICLNVSQF